MIFVRNGVIYSGHGRLARTSNPLKNIKLQVNCLLLFDKKHFWEDKFFYIHLSHIMSEQNRVPCVLCMK